MLVQHVQTLFKTENRSIDSKIEHLVWSASLNKFAVCLNNSNQITLFDSSLMEKKEKFTAKSNLSSKSSNDFHVKGLAFSLDGTKIAVGQTDCVIHVYKLGVNWGEKKSIIGKYSLQSQVTCLLWISNGIVFGSSDGKIKLIQTTSNRMSNLYSNTTAVVALSTINDKVAAAYLDGLIVVISLSKNDDVFKCKTSFPTFALCLVNEKCLAYATNSSLTILELNSKTLRSQDETSLDNLNRQVLELNSQIYYLTCLPNGELLVCGCVEEFHLFTRENHLWVKSQTVALNGYGLINSLSLSPDGTKLITSSINGLVDLFEIKWKKSLLSKYYEINFIGSNQISIRNNRESQSSIPDLNVLIRSKNEIKRVKILSKRYVIVWTRNSLIFCDLEVASSLSVSNYSANSRQPYVEIDWSGMATNELRFCFDYENVVLVNVIGELFIFQFSNGQLLTSVRTDFISPHLISVRVNERGSSSKTFAYLLDAKTIIIVDLTNEKQLASFNHNECVDWIELNETGRQLLIRDKQLNLYLSNLDLNASVSSTSSVALKSAGSSSSRTTLLNNDFHHLLSKCTFVQWVPLSDVCIGQSRDKLYVFFDFEKPTIYDLNPNQQAVGIVRENGTSRVLLLDDEGQESSIELNETFLEFDTALQNNQLRKAMFFLENQTDSTSVSIWKKLNEIAFERQDWLVLERSLAAIGNLVKSQYVHECANDDLKKVIFKQDWAEFENTNNFETVIQTYLDLYKWNAAIDYANRMGHNDRKEQLEQEYYEYLMKNKREFEAGQIKEKKGDFIEAIKLYLKSSRLLDASRLVFMSWKRHNSLPEEILKQIVNQLKQNQFYEEAGYFYEQKILNLEDNDELALDCYKRGNLFDLAIELARRKFPNRVVNLEEEYGDYLVSRNDYERAIAHYIESGSNQKALNCTLKAHDYEKAAELALALGNELRPEICKRIADHYLKFDIEMAVKLYLNSGFINEAVKLLNEQKQFTRAFKLVKDTMSMSEEDTKGMFLKIAQQFESDGKLKDAEKIYLLCDQSDRAISMYKDAKQYESMIKLVSQYHPDLLVETHKHLAKELEQEKFYSKAEIHYLSAGEWRSVIQMYKKVNRFEEAYRVARAYGNADVVRQVGLVWARSLSNVEDAVKMLNKYGLLNQVIDEAVENELYDFARSLAKQIGENKLNEINLKWATKLEEEGKYSEAERLYLECGKPREAVLMYLHLEQFENAIRIAEKEVKDDNLVKELLTNEAKNILSKHETRLLNTDNQDDKLNILKRVESLLIKAGKPELIINLYKQHRLHDRALRISESHATHLVSAVKREMSMLNQNGYSMPNIGNENGEGLISLRRESLSINNDDLSRLSCDQIQDRLESAQKGQNKDEEARYALLLSAKHVSMMNYVKALNVLNRYNVLLVLEETRKLILRISTKLFAMEDIVEPELELWKLLRDTLFNIFTSKTINNQLNDELEKHLLIAHFMCLKSSLTNYSKQLTASNTKTNLMLTSVNELNLKLSIALLRYTDLLRVDRMFYEAGQLCRESNRTNYAFIFLNHFLDLVDAIQEQDADLVDYTNLEQTDIAKKVPLPSAVFLIQGDHHLDGEKEIEQIKSWILEKSMDNSNYSLFSNEQQQQTSVSNGSSNGQTNGVNHINHTNNHLNSNNDSSLTSYPSSSLIYEASLIREDGNESMVCLVTAYPVLDKYEFKPGGKYAANRSDWNQLVMIIKVRNKHSDSHLILSLLKFFY